MTTSSSSSSETEVGEGKEIRKKSEFHEDSNTPLVNKWRAALQTSEFAGMLFANLPVIRIH